MVARDRDTAVRAAKMVTVQYEDVKKPILTIKEAIKENRVSVGIDMFTGKEATATLGNADGGSEWMYCHDDLGDSCILRSLFIL